MDFPLFILNFVEISGNQASIWNNEKIQCIKRANIHLNNTIICQIFLFFFVEGIVNMFNPFCFVYNWPS